MRKILTERDLVNMAMDIHSKGLFLPENTMIYVSMPRPVFEKIVLNKQAPKEMLNLDSMIYMSDYGINFKIEANDD